MTRLRVLKPLKRFKYKESLRSFIHYDPFEGTETANLAASAAAASGFIHYDPFEGTETSLVEMRIDRVEVSFTMTRLRVLKQGVRNVYTCEVLFHSL